MLRRVRTVGATWLRKLSGRHVITSPRETLLPYLTPAQDSAMTYPSNMMPGARDLATPAGVMRVNEWGSPDGHKIILVHGASTPSPIWSEIAAKLVKNNCYVLTFDLWGRGYSDTPLTIGQGCHDFTFQIRSAVDSSPVLSSSTDPITIVGYSLGGTIAVDFARENPSRVRNIILMAPGGLLEHSAWYMNSCQVRFPWLTTKSSRRKFIMKVLGVDQNHEYRHPKAADTSSSPNLSSETGELPEAQKIEVEALTQWQFDWHQGFVDAYFGTIREGPIRHQERIYREACDIMMSSDTATKSLPGSKLLVFLGEDDTIIDADEFEQDLLRLIPKSRTKFVKLPGDHAFIVLHGDRIVKDTLEHMNRD